MGPGRAVIAAAPAPDAGDLIAVGHVSAAHGIKGWVWIHSLTDPASNIFGYRPWYLRDRDGLRQVKVVDWREQGKGIVALLDIATDRNVAETLRNLEIQVPKSALPELEEGDYYWSDLIDLEVRTAAGQLLGVVHGLAVAEGIRFAARLAETVIGADPVWTARQDSLLDAAAIAQINGWAGAPAGTASATTASTGPPRHSPRRRSTSC